MNKELQDRLIEYLGSLDVAVRQAGGFVVEQAPLVVQELIDWTFWGGLVGAVAFSLLAAMFFWVSRRCAARMDNIDNNPTWTFGCIVAAGLFIACLGCAVVDAGNMIKAKLAPRVVVLEKIAELVNPANQ